ncbi:ATP-binding protein [Paenibacillus sp. GCM10023252]|uniref:ATP-binding protein n=1 Tax=Paenibacillus sp. GCM10023252 TaxID=3252649 RepID=UPI00360FFEB4
MRIRLRQSLAVILFLFIITFFLLYLTVVMFRQPFIGVEIKRELGGHYIVKSLEPAGQALAKGMTVGDRIISVDHKPTGQFDNVRKFLSIENASSIVVLHSNQEEQTIRFEKGWSREHSGWELFIQLVISGISLFVFCAFSIFLYLKRKDDEAALMLILFFITIGLSYYSSAASYLRDPVGISFIYVVLPFVPILFLQFMNMYLKRYHVTFISVSLQSFLFSCVTFVGLFSLLYIWTDLFSSEMFEYIRLAYYGILLLGNFICVYMLVRKFFKHRYTKLSSLFKITLSSHLVAFTPFATMNLLPLFVGGEQILPAAFTALFLFVLPVVYFYLLTSNKLFDIDFILTRFKYYTSLAFVPAALVVGCVAIVVNNMEEQSWISWFQIFVVVYIGMTLFLYGKELIDNRFRPKLFKAMYSYQDSLDRFSRQIARVMKRADLETVLKREIGALLPVARIEFLLVDHIEREVTPSGDTHDEQETAGYLLQISDKLQVGEVISLPHGLGLVIGRQRTRFHLVWIGSKTNHTRFNSDELRWLKTMANYASIVFENLYLIEGLIEDLESEVRKEQTTSPWVLRLLFCLSENERRKLAADLHDSALQDQLIWYRKLESLMMDYDMPDALGQELESIKEGLLDVIHQIRETCNELRPPLLKEMGIVEAVESIVEHTQMRVNFAVEFRAKPLPRPLNEEQITAIYRIVQELLRNADKHAQADRITLEIEQKNHNIFFRYTDDGIGMDVNQMNASFEHMGLSGIKERVTSLEGEVTFRSQRGSGLEVVIQLPETMTTSRSERGIMRDSYLIS